MLQSQISQAARLQLTETIIDAKLRKSLSWQALAEGTGLSLAYVTAALLGQHALPAELQAVPLRGSLADSVPADPTIYRFYEIVQVYGTTLKALVHEQFGDGIISAVNFKLDIKKVDDPEGGSRAVIKLDGKYLPYKPF
jgi:cyanate lyase